MLKQVFINSYNDNSVVLSSGETIEGDFILDSNGNYFKFSRNEQPIEEFLMSLSNIPMLKEYTYKKEILLIGCGKNFIVPTIKLRKEVKDLGLGLEWVISRSAFNTFNLIVEDYRSCVAVFINS